MRLRHRHRYNMLIRLRNFGAAHGQLFPETSSAHEAFGVIAAEVARLATLDVAELSASQGRRAEHKDAARKALADCLTRAAFTARVVAKTNPAPGARIDLPLPADDLQLLTLARQFAKAAAPCASAFASHGVPIAELEDRVSAFGRARHEREIHRDNRVKARAEIEASFGRAMDAVAVLDVNVANRLRSDPAAMAVWKHDRRIHPRQAAGTGEPTMPIAPTEPLSDQQETSASSAVAASPAQPSTHAEAESVRQVPQALSPPAERVRLRLLRAVADSGFQGAVPLQRVPNHLGEIVRPVLERGHAIGKAGHHEVGRRLAAGLCK